MTIEALPPEAHDTPDYRARITVERRRDPQRREGHTPPVIVEAKAPTRSVVFNELFEIARDNVAVARGLIRWQSERRKSEPRSS